MRPTDVRQQRIRKTAASLAAVGFAVLTLASADLVHAQSASVELIKPRLEIPIPNVTFSGTTLNLIGEYFAGAYKYLLSIVGIFATVMMMVGGFQYLTSGGDKNRADGGRKRIMNALTGLILAFGSYTMLYVINPALVKFEGLQIASVTTEPFEAGIFTQMGTTESDTAMGDSSPPPVPGEITYEFTSCPFQYEASYTEENARKKEFIAKAPQFITKTDIRERIVQVAQLADMCDPVLGSCGTTVGTIIAMAFKGHANFEKMSRASSSKNANCLDPNLAAGKGADDRFNCNGFSLGSSFSVGPKLRKEQYGRRCTIDQVTSVTKKHAKLVADGTINKKTGKPWTAEDRLSASSVSCNATNCTSNGVIVPRTPCAKTDTDARLEFVELVKKGGLPGYPKSVTDTLRPGDYINIYNGNTDLTGGHAILFMGWHKDGKRAYVVQGGGGCAKNIFGKTECRVARPGLTCLKEECEGDIRPITSVYRWQ